MKPTNPPSHKAPAGGSRRTRRTRCTTTTPRTSTATSTSRALVWSMVVMFGTVIGTAVLMYLLFFYFLERAGRGQGPEAVAAGDAGDDDAADDDRLAVLRQRARAEADDGEPMYLQGSTDAEQQVLHGYGWVDEKAGVARIPIDEAKKLMLERGLPCGPIPLTDDAPRHAAPGVGRVFVGPERHAHAAADRAPPRRRQRPRRRRRDTTRTSKGHEVHGFGVRSSSQ